jgi:Glycosyl transferase family 2.
MERADPVLADLLRSWPDDGDIGRSVADLRREEHSVRLRRHVWWGRLPPGPSVSVVLTSRRPHYVAGALQQIARQRYTDLEVVLALHGFPAAPVRDAVAAFPHAITVVEADAAAVFGDVLDQAVRRATGELIVKWDDDDWYGPDHLADLLLARGYSGADVVGTAAEFFYLEPLGVTIRRTDYSSEVWSDHVAGGTILLSRSTYEEAGGFQSLPRGVDSALLKTIHAAGGRIYRTHGLGYVLRRAESAEHTWKLPLAHFLRVATNQWRGFRPSRIMEDGKHT